MLIGNDDKTSQSQNFALLSQYTGRRMFFLMEQRQQILLRQSAENFFGEDEENISERNQRIRKSARRNSILIRIKSILILKI